MRKKGGKDIVVVGGGIIPDEDKPKLERSGIVGNFGPGTSLKTIIDFVNSVGGAGNPKPAKKKRAK